MLNHAYERALLVACEDVALADGPLSELPWAEFWLNPRMLRGSDFLMRWSQGVWSEKRLIEAVNATAQFFALPYGPSGVAPEDPRGVELYFERLQAAGLDDHKRPDLLIFRREDQRLAERLVAELGGEAELPFTPDEDDRVRRLLDRAVLAVECENSLWHAARMPDYGKPLNEKRIARGQPGLAKGAVLPTVILKDEDMPRLAAWQRRERIPIHIWHVFFDRAYGIGFDRARKLIADGLIAPTVQTFQAPGGAITRKSIFKIYYHYAYELGVSVTEPALKAQAITDKNGHVLPYVTFDGGELKLSNEAVAMLAQFRHRVPA
ncbi:MAG: AccI family restriction endonuclease [Acetobacteraceae bacterium]|nr:AccI family restriction endonuclease [Acetobacteraceae bacterium]